MIVAMLETAIQMTIARIATGDLRTMIERHEWRDSGYQAARGSRKRSRAASATAMARASRSIGKKKKNPELEIISEESLCLSRWRKLPPSSIPR
jgi:hypothetical protein